MLPEQSLSVPSILCFWLRRLRAIWQLKDVSLKGDWGSILVALCWAGDTKRTHGSHYRVFTMMMNVLSATVFGGGTSASRLETKHGVTSVAIWHCGHLPTVSSGPCLGLLQAFAAHSFSTYISEVLWEELHQSPGNTLFSHVVLFIAGDTCLFLFWVSRAGSLAAGAFGEPTCQRQRTKTDV